jgi:predicted ribosome-associated RNA-binding protein Tma20
MMIHSGGGVGGGTEAGAGGGDATPPPKPDIAYIVGSYIAVVLAAIVAILLASKNDVTIGVSEGFAPFAVIYLVAQAIERGLQPLSYLVGKAQEKSKVKDQLRKAKGARSLALLQNETETVASAATSILTKQKKLDVLLADRAILFWAIATVVSLLVCGFLELGLIQSIAKVTGDSGEVPDGFRYADVVITGIAIGAGTKPLHDFIALAQNAKQKADSGTGIG